MYMPDELVLNVNGKSHSVQAPPDTPLLYVLRDELGLNDAPVGTGELATTTTAAAVANAIFDATSARVRQVPFTLQRVMAALPHKDSSLSAG